jgi:protein-arginine kinase activator protein McsA
MICEICQTKVNVRNIIRSEDQNHVYCKKCVKEDKKEMIQNQEFEEAKNELFVKSFIYTYSLLYKNKIIS